MTVLMDGLSWLFLMSGIFLALSGAVGVMRFPDLYTRTHAASITDTLSVFLIIMGLIFQAGFTLISIKLLFILGFLWYTSPAASFSLVRAAHHMGLSIYEKR